MFGEYIPLVRWLPFLEWFDAIGNGWMPGDKAVTFQLTGLNESASEPASVIYLGSPDGTREHPIHQAKTSTLICFEDTFPGVARTAAQDDLDFFVNLTNDGWFGHSSEQWQHMANAVFRAVENGIPLLRCANNGVTCYIDGHGRMEAIFRDAHGSEYGKGVLSVKIPLLAPDQKNTATFYNRHGDWFGWGCVALTAATLLTRARNFLP
jgi:apolipoprotein N-acyltransferase